MELITPAAEGPSMQVERPLVWLVALAATAVSVLAYATPGATAPADVVLVALLVVVALPLLVVYATVLFDRGSRGWR